jgi:hypothetical protein
VTRNNSSSFGNKSGLGKSGVHHRYHTREETKASSEDHKPELYECHTRMEGEVK